MGHNRSGTVMNVDVPGRFLCAVVQGEYVDRGNASSQLRCGAGNLQTVLPIPDTVI